MYVALRVDNARYTSVNPEMFKTGFFFFISMTHGNFKIRIHGV